MSNTDGCGGHGKDGNIWIRDESCDMCHRWDYMPSSNEATDALKEVILADWIRLGQAIPEHEDMAHYENNKSAHRKADQYIDHLLNRGFYLVALPSPCAQCGKVFSSEKHMNFMPDEEGQHPYVVPE